MYRSKRSRLNKKRLRDKVANSFEQVIDVSDDIDKNLRFIKARLGTNSDFIVRQSW